MTTISTMCKWLFKERHLVLIFGVKTGLDPAWMLFFFVVNLMISGQEWLDDNLSGYHSQCFTKLCVRDQAGGHKAGYWSKSGFNQSQTQQGQVFQHVFCVILKCTFHAFLKAPLKHQLVYLRAAEVMILSHQDSVNLHNAWCTALAKGACVV